MRVIAAGQRGGGLSRLLAMGIILVAIVLIAVWFGVRSEGGRSLIESQLSKRLGVTVSAERTYIGWPYVLVLENIRTEGFSAAGTPGFSVAEVRLGRGVRYWRLVLRQAIVRVQEVEDTVWKPSFLSRLAALRHSDARDLVRLTDDFRDTVRLQVRDLTLGWLNAEGVETAAVRGVDFRLEPVRVAERRMHYFALDIHRATGIALGCGRDMRWEWLTTHELDYIELTKDTGSDRPVIAPADAELRESP